MAARDCWHCGVRTHMAPHRTAFVRDAGDGKTKQVWGAFKCDNCSALRGYTVEIALLAAGLSGALGNVIMVSDLPPSRERRRRPVYTERRLDA
jgi:hypothetical protein